MKLSHVDDSNRPRMVNVGDKGNTRRIAHARAVVRLPDDVFKQMEGAAFETAKGPIAQTAILAGIMASKKTSELIPLCHPIGLDNCDLNVTVRDPSDIVIECRAEAHHKTGVEMEALTAVSVAALTVYDMCKALSHDITIAEIRLLEKTGGKSDYHHPEA